MNNTGSWFCRIVRTGLLAGVGVTSTALLASADDARPQQSPATRTPLLSARVINTMIDDALRDGTLDAAEHQMILGQAQRMLSPNQAAEVETKLTKLAKSAATRDVRLSALDVHLGKPVEVEPVAETEVTVIESQTSTARRVTRPTATPTTQAAYTEPTSQAHNAPAAAADPACCAENCCSDSFFDNLYLFGAVDAWRGPLDGNQSNNFGARIGFNGGMPLVRDRCIGAQLGMSYGAYDYHGRFDLSPETEASSIEDQIFVTAGLFKHCDFSNACNPDRISWGVVYDYMLTDNTSAGTAELSLGQFRGQIGYACDEENEVGLWGAISDGTDRSFNVLGARHTTRSIDQLNLYWRHKWCTYADTRAYIGIAEEPGEFVFGVNGQMPLNNYWALFGGFQYILPSTSGGDPGFRDEFWNVTVGFAFYPGGNAITRTVCGNCWQPLLPVADNGSFALDLGF